MGQGPSREGKKNMMTGKAIANRGWLLAGVAAAVVLGAAHPALAVGDDASIQQRIEARLAKARIGAEGAVEVSVRNGSAVLTGAVTTVAAQRDASRLARKDARVVENRIQVLPTPRSDVDLVKDVRSAILRYPRLSVFDSIEFSVDKGAVVLSGSVLQPYRRNDIERAVSRIEGVRAVENEIGVQDASPFDAALRWKIYSRIYGHVGSVLPGAGERADAPVRIVVNHGRVTLTGWVNSAVDRRLVGNAALDTLAFEVDNRVKIDGEPPAVDSKPATKGPGVEI
jgi:osmotically-inducible protein OsmY